MTEIARFFGIMISMYYNDHPPPHFHVRHGTQKAIIDIETLFDKTGSLPEKICR